VNKNKNKKSIFFKITKISMRIYLYICKYTYVYNICKKLYCNLLNRKLYFYKNNNALLRKFERQRERVRDGGILMFNSYIIYSYKLINYNYLMLVSYREEKSLRLKEDYYH